LKGWFFTEDWAERLFSLPMHPYLKPEDPEWIAKVIQYYKPWHKRVVKKTIQATDLKVFLGLFVSLLITNSTIAQSPIKSVL
jgi:hypothetical protein